MFCKIVLFYLEPRDVVGVDSESKDTGYKGEVKWKF